MQLPSPNQHHCGLRHRTCGLARLHCKVDTGTHRQRPAACCFLLIADPQIFLHKSATSGRFRMEAGGAPGMLCMYHRGGVGSEPDDVTVPPKVRRGGRWYGLGTDAGLSLTDPHSKRPSQQCTQHADSEMRGGLAQNADRGSQNEQGKQVGGRPTSGAAANAQGARKQNRQRQLDGRRLGVGETGTTRRPSTGPRQPRGAASTPPHPPQPHQTQPQDEARTTRSRTGAPAKLREGTASG